MVSVTDVMVDIETTGTRSGYSGILQLSAVKFNIDTEEVDPDVFDRCPALLPNRFWSDSTRQFWNQHQSVLQGIIRRQEEPLPVFEDFSQWVAGHPQPLRFWSKPLSFDWPMIASHFEQLNLEMPFHYRTARDLNTYIACCRGRSADHVDMRAVEDGHNGQLHNALSDCVLQIKMLFAAKNEGKPVVEYAEYQECSE